MAWYYPLLLPSSVSLNHNPALTYRSLNSSDLLVTRWRPLWPCYSYYRLLSSSYISLFPRYRNHNPTLIKINPFSDLLVTRWRPLWPCYSLNSTSLSSTLLPPQPPPPPPPHLWRTREGCLTRGKHKGLVSTGHEQVNYYRTPTLPTIYYS